MKGLLFPAMNKAEIGFIIKYALLGAILAGLYGILHDQITYTISSEYFSKIKFKQFYYANVGLGNRFFVATIGFLATWWVGFFIGWFLSRVIVSVRDEANPAKKIKHSFIIVFITASIVSFSVGLYSFLVSEFYNHQAWQSTFDYYGIRDADAFMRVVYIHYASYSGGVIGLIAALLALKFLKNKHSLL